MTDTIARALSSQDRKTLAALALAAEDLPPPELAESFGAAFARFGGADLVLLGEATHGTSEFYRARAAITRYLIRNHGFNIVAVEADWPDAQPIDRYVRHYAPEPSRATAFARFPSWMWRNLEVLEFADWLRAENEHRPEPERVEFRGLDIYSLSNSISAVLDYLDGVDPAAAQQARRRYGCLTPWQDEPSKYGHFALIGGETCEQVVTEQLIALLKQRLAYCARDGEQFFNAAQNARIIRAAERYYRSMYHGARESWNLRDRHMFDTLQSLLAHRPGGKAIVWAHNSHVGNAAATSMGWEGEFNIGELCRTAFGNGMVVIGFGTDRGTVAAASDWDSPMEIKSVLPAREDSFEYLFRRAGHARALYDWRNRPDLQSLLAEPRLERAIGVVYRPDTELLSHYFRAVLSDQFDAMVWFETSRAVTPLQPEHASGRTETYPFGL
jgi:erythromycin esterase-like protein